MMRLLIILTLVFLSSLLSAQEYKRTINVKYTTDHIKLDGILNDFLLKELHLTKEKIEKMLIRDNLLIEDIYYAMYENNKLFIIRKDELK